MLLGKLTGVFHTLGEWVRWSWCFAFILMHPISSFIFVKLCNNRSSIQAHYTETSIHSEWIWEKLLFILDFYQQLLSC